MESKIILDKARITAILKFRTSEQINRIINHAIDAELKTIDDELAYRREKKAEELANRRRIEDLNLAPMYAEVCNQAIMHLSQKTDHITLASEDGNLHIEIVRSTHANNRVSTRISLRYMNVYPLCCEVMTAIYKHADISYYYCGWGSCYDMPDGNSVAEVTFEGYTSPLSL